ncbi:MAG: type IV pilus assembly protein PilM [Planctomycetota bacterium]|nr:type IV pilus assembly protein PilM [Planctomycetota bacterium]
METMTLKNLQTLNWRRLLKLEQYTVFGLDIGSSSVKIVQLRKDGHDWVVTAAGMAEIPDGMEDNKTRRDINTVKAIRKCFGATGIVTKFAVYGVCGPEVAVRCFKFPALPREEITGAVTLEASQVCPFNIEEGVVDYQLISNSTDSATGVLVAATNKMVDKKNRLVQDAELNGTLADADGLALLNCFTESEKSYTNKTVAILNVGSSFTTLAIVGNNSLPFVRDIAYAGNDIIKQIADENNVSAETITKILFGSSDNTQEQTELQLVTSLAKACQKLITDVTETLRYYAAQEKSTFVEKIFICGGFSLVKGFVELFNNNFPASVVLWNPFEKMRCEADRTCMDVLQKNGPAMAVAAGLAMRSI